MQNTCISSKSTYKLSKKYDNRDECNKDSILEDDQDNIQAR